ncbi:MAG TPA: ABC transporter permease [Methylomirabilota bacterium]|nr:ABC transporter permease [Methylomirabilota bacterium]
MKTKDLFAESYSALIVNKIRTILTMLGIVIGIGSVIAMVGIGQGARGSIQANIESIGSNLISVTAGAQKTPGSFVSSGLGSAQTLTQEDVEALRSQLSSIKALDAELSRRSQVTAKGTNTNTQIMGTDPNYPLVRNINLESGTFISDQQVTSKAKVAVLGPSTRDTLFGEGSDPIGQTIRIGATQFKVIGVTQAKGGSGFTNQDDMIFIPISTAQQYLVGLSASGKAYVSTIAISAIDAQSMTNVQNQTTEILLQRHGISDLADADFTVLNQSDLVSAASSVTQTLTLLLASIAGISLLVGGIGIMNMMLTTVTERTREIGLRKAIGATRSDINFQFLTESILLTFTGGGIGIIFGWLVSLLTSKFGITSQITFSSVVLAFGVSAAIGVVFGYYPARRASRLNPIEALRYE